MSTNKVSKNKNDEEISESANRETPNLAQRFYADNAPEGWEVFVSPGPEKRMYTYFRPPSGTRLLRSNRELDDYLKDHPQELAHERDIGRGVQIEAEMLDEETNQMEWIRGTVQKRDKSVFLVKFVVNNTTETGEWEEKYSLSEKGKEWRWPVLSKKDFENSLSTARFAYQQSKAEEGSKLLDAPPSDLAQSSSPSEIQHPRSVSQGESTVEEHFRKTGKGGIKSGDGLDGKKSSGAQPEGSTCRKRPTEDMECEATALEVHRTKESKRKKISPEVRISTNMSKCEELEREKDKITGAFGCNDHQPGGATESLNGIAGEKSPSKNASSRYFAEDQAGTFSERAEVSLGGAIEALLKVGGVEAWHPGTVTQVDHSRRSFRAAFVFEAGAQVLKFSTRLQGSEWRWPLADLNETSEKGKLNKGVEKMGMDLVDTPEKLPYIGAKVRVRFESDKFYFGKLVSHDKKSDSWGLLYEDGEQEAVTLPDQDIDILSVKRQRKISSAAQDAKHPSSPPLDLNSVTANKHAPDFRYSVGSLVRVLFEDGIKYVGKLKNRLKSGKFLILFEDGEEHKIALPHADVEPSEIETEYEIWEEEVKRKSKAHMPSVPWWCETPTCRSFEPGDFDVQIPASWKRLLIIPPEKPVITKETKKVRGRRIAAPIGIKDQRAVEIAEGDINTGLVEKNMSATDKPNAPKRGRKKNVSALNEECADNLPSLPRESVDSGAGPSQCGLFFEESGADQLENTASERRRPKPSIEIDVKNAGFEPRRANARKKKIKQNDSQLSLDTEGKRAGQETTRKYKRKEKDKDISAKISAKAPKPPPITQESISIPCPVVPQNPHAKSALFKELSTLLLQGESENDRLAHDETDFVDGLCIFLNPADSMNSKEFCLKCGSSSDRGDIIFCRDCGDCFHTFCFDPVLKISPEKRAMWRCPACRICEICAGEENWEQMLCCDECDRGFHTYCLNPPLKNVPDEGWRCSDCVRCLSCGSRTPGARASDRWRKDSKMCQPCFQLYEKQNFCPICEKVYKDNENSLKMVECDCCSRWVHIECGGIEAATYAKMIKDDTTWECPRCKGEYSDDTYHERKEKSPLPQTKTIVENQLLLEDYCQSRLKGLLADLITLDRLNVGPEIEEMSNQALDVPGLQNVLCSESMAVDIETKTNNDDTAEPMMEISPSETGCVEGTSEHTPSGKINSVDITFLSNPHLIPVNHLKPGSLESSNAIPVSENDFLVSAHSADPTPHKTFTTSTAASQLFKVQCVSKREVYALFRRRISKMQKRVDKHRYHDPALFGMDFINIIPSPENAPFMLREELIRLKSKVQDLLGTSPTRSNLPDRKTVLPKILIRARVVAKEHSILEGPSQPAESEVTSISFSRGVAAERMLHPQTSSQNPLTKRKYERKNPRPDGSSGSRSLQQKTGSVSQTPAEKRKLEEALRFCERVRKAFQNDEKVYKRFLELLKENHGPESRKDVFAEISALFSNHPSLLDEFHSFAGPEKHTSASPSNPPQSACSVSVSQPSRTTSGLPSSWMPAAHSSSNSSDSTSLHSSMSSTVQMSSPLQPHESPAQRYVQVQMTTNFSQMSQSPSTVSRVNLQPGNSWNMVSIPQVVGQSQTKSFVNCPVYEDLGCLRTEHSRQNFQQQNGGPLTLISAQQMSEAFERQKQMHVPIQRDALPMSTYSLASPTLGVQARPSSSGAAHSNHSWATMLNNGHSSGQSTTVRLADHLLARAQVAGNDGISGLCRNFDAQQVHQVCSQAVSSTHQVCSQQSVGGQHLVVSTLLGPTLCTSSNNAVPGSYRAQNQPSISSLPGSMLCYSNNVSPGSFRSPNQSSDSGLMAQQAGGQARLQAHMDIGQPSERVIARCISQTDGGEFDCPNLSQGILEDVDLDDHREFIHGPTLSNAAKQTTNFVAGAAGGSSQASCQNQTLQFPGRIQLGLATKPSLPASAHGVASAASVGHVFHFVSLKPGGLPPPPATKPFGAEWPGKKKSSGPPMQGAAGLAGRIPTPQFSYAVVEDEDEDDEDGDEMREKRDESKGVYKDVRLRVGMESRQRCLFTFFLPHKLEEVPACRLGPFRSRSKPQVRGERVSRAARLARRLFVEDLIAEVSRAEDRRNRGVLKQRFKPVEGWDTRELERLVEQHAVAAGVLCFRGNQLELAAGKEGEAPPQLRGVAGGGASGMLPMWIDNRACVLCGIKGDRVVLGRLLFVEMGVWGHVACLCWSMGVYEDTRMMTRGTEKCTLLCKVHDAVGAARGVSCDYCGCKGASVRCQGRGCFSSWHFGCAVLGGHAFFRESRTFCHACRTDKALLERSGGPAAMLAPADLCWIGSRHMRVMSRARPKLHPPDLLGRSPATLKRCGTGPR